MLNFDDVIAAQHTLTTNQSKLRFRNNLLKSRSSNLILIVAQKDLSFFFSYQPEPLGEVKRQLKACLAINWVFEIFVCFINIPNISCGTE